MLKFSHTIRRCRWAWSSCSTDIFGAVMIFDADDRVCASAVCGFVCCERREVKLSQCVEYYMFRYVFPLTQAHQLQSDILFSLLFSRSNSLRLNRFVDSIELGIVTREHTKSRNLARAPSVWCVAHIEEIFCRSKKLKNCAKVLNRRKKDIWRLDKERPILVSRLCNTKLVKRESSHFENLKLSQHLEIATFIWILSRIDCLQLLKKVIFFLLRFSHQHFYARSRIQSIRRESWFRHLAKQTV